MTPPRIRRTPEAQQRLAAKAISLRQVGLSYAVIAKRLTISQTHARLLCKRYDQEAAKVRDRVMRHG